MIPEQLPKIRFTRIDHVMLCIPEGAEDEARNFYGDILGLRELNDLGYPIPNNAIWFQIGNIQLHIRAENVHANISQRHPAFEIENLDEAESVLTANGISIRQDSLIPGRKRFSFRDPFGNRIELIEYLE